MGLSLPPCSVRSAQLRCLLQDWLCLGSGTNALALLGLQEARFKQKENEVTGWTPLEGQRKMPRMILSPWILLRLPTLVLLGLVFVAISVQTGSKRGSAGTKGNRNRRILGISTRERRETHRRGKGPFSECQREGRMSPRVKPPCQPPASRAHTFLH